MYREYDKGDEVRIRDFPLGKPLNVLGRVVGILGGDFYNILMLNGLNEGLIRRYKSWSLAPKFQETQCKTQTKEMPQEEGTDGS